MREGIPTDKPQIQKLWQVSKILKTSPFALTDHNEAQLDFILEMYAKDNPDEFIFQRAGQVAPVSEAERMAAWEHVLVGSAREQFLPKMPLDAIRAQEAALATTLQTLRKAASSS